MEGRCRYDGHPNTMCNNRHYYLDRCGTRPRDRTQSRDTARTRAPAPDTKPCLASPCKVTVVSRVVRRLREQVDVDTAAATSWVEEEQQQVLDLTDSAVEVEGEDAVLADPKKVEEPKTTDKPESKTDPENNKKNITVKIKTPGKSPMKLADFIKLKTPQKLKTSNAPLLATPTKGADIPTSPLSPTISNSPFSPTIMPTSPFAVPLPTGPLSPILLTSPFSKLRATKRALEEELDDPDEATEAGKNKANKKKPAALVDLTNVEETVDLTASPEEEGSRECRCEDCRFVTRPHVQRMVARAFPCRCHPCRLHRRARWAAPIGCIPPRRARRAKE